MPPTKSVNFLVPQPEPPAISTRKVAELLGISHKTVINYYHDGTLEGYQKGLRLTSPIMIYLHSFEKFRLKRRNK